MDVLAVASMVLAQAAAATAAITPESLLGAWRPDLGVVVALVGLSVLYWRAVTRLWTSAGRRVGISTTHVGLFAGGVAALAVALLTPLDTLSSALFSAHMVQHLLLMVVAAPLLVAGRLHVAIMPLLPLGLRRWWGRRITGALRRHAPLGIVAAVVVHVAVVVAWHLPGLYDLSLRTDWVHAVEHLTMVAAAVPFWVAMGATRTTPVVAAGLAAFVVALSFTLLSAAMTIAATPWYASHLSTTAAWGLTPLEDQQLAAAIMWVPGGLVYLGAAMGTVLRWIHDDERRQAVASTRLHTS